MTYARAFLKVIFLFSLMIQASGCTLIGLAIGAGVDLSSSGELRPIDPNEIGSLHPGQLVAVVRTNQDSIRGTYLGMLQRPTDEYASAFAPFAHSLDGGMFPPALGERIKIVTDREGETKSFQGCFGGVDSNCVYIKTTDASESAKIPIAYITTILDTARRIVRGDTIRALMGQNRIPCLSAVTIDTGSDTLRIPIQEIKFLLAHEFAHATLWGLGTGFVIDIAVLTAAGIGMRWSWH